LCYADASFFLRATPTGGKQSSVWQACDSQRAIKIVTPFQLEVGIGHEQDFRFTVAAEPPAVVSERGSLNTEMGVAAPNDVFFDRVEIGGVFIDVVFFDPIWQL
jgi:hypothetical protein